MQISRHWRLNAQRYRLEGLRYFNGSMRLEPTPRIENIQISATETTTPNRLVEPGENMASDEMSTKAQFPENLIGGKLESRG